MHNKKGFFFILDALLALTIVSLGVFLMASSYTFTPTRPQAEIILEDTFSYMSETRIGDLNDPFAGIGGQLWREGIISDADNSLLEEVGELYHTTNTSLTEQFVRATVSDLIPPQYRIQITVDDDLAYPAEDSAALADSRDNAPLYLARSTVGYGITNESTQELWGPSTITVSVWQG